MAKERLRDFTSGNIALLHQKHIAHNCQQIEIGQDHFRFDESSGYF